MAGDFRVTRRVQFAETDLAGVMHFSNYFRLMEETEHAFWRSIGLSVIMDGPDRQLSWPRVAAGFEYFSPAKFEDELELVFVLEHVGERSLTYQVEFFRSSERIACGKSTVVCCATTPGAFKPVPIPDDIRAKLSGNQSMEKTQA